MSFTCFRSYAGQHTAHERVIEFQAVPTARWLNARYDNRTDSVTTGSIADVAAVPHLHVDFCCSILTMAKLARLMQKPYMLKATLHIFSPVVPCTHAILFFQAA